MSAEKIKSQIEALKAERTKLYKVKSASPTQILERVYKVERRIKDLEAKLAESK